MSNPEPCTRAPLATSNSGTPMCAIVMAALVCCGCSTGETQSFFTDVGPDLTDVGDVPGDTPADAPGEDGCAPGLQECEGECVDLYSDPLNCGSCGRQCEGADHALAVCVAGGCDTECEEGYTDLDGDGSCDYACFPTSDTESCNGSDDDCDGETDEDFDCAAGSAVSCITTCGSTGDGFCGEDCTLPGEDGCSPPAEVCNGSDDDCDGEADEDFDCAAGTMVPCETPCGTTGEGRCHDDCTLPLPGECGIGVEVCNGLDDNCNGSVDEGYLCVMGSEVSCTTSCGSTGTGNCSATCTPPTTSECVPPGDTCNGLDDDCDGEADEDFDCAVGETVSCTTTCGTTGSGPCTGSCVPPDPSTCTPPAESCNGSDDDCDGEADEDFDCVLWTTGLPCTTGGGAAGTRDCSVSCTYETCCAASETCGNGWDDDCDGTVDDGCCDPLDTCGCAGVISTSGTWSGSTSALVDDYHGGCGSTGGLDAVYQLTLSTSQFVHLDTVGSSFDTVLYVFDSTCGGTALACNDDFSGLQSQVELTLGPGTYHVVVDGYSSSSYGSYTLNVSGSSGGCGSDGTISVPGTASGSTSGRTDSYTPSCASSYAGDAVYEMTVSSAATITIDTIGSSYDTVLYVLDSSCATEVACNDDYSGLQSQVSTYFSAGTYYILVDGFSSSTGSFVLDVY